MATKKTEAAQEAPALNLEDVQKQIMAMLAEAKAEAAKIVEEAKEAAAQMNAPAMDKAEAEAAKAEAKAKANELVEIKLFKDNGKYKDDVFVSVNGETIAIKRGEKVQIKRKFAEVLENSDNQDYETSKLIEAKTNQFEADVAAGRL